MDNSYPLSGYLHKDDGDWYATILKYDYNFHHSKYGRLYLLQTYKKIEDFYEDVSDKLIKCFSNEGEEQVFNKFNEKIFGKDYNHWSTESDVFFLHIKDCIKKEKYKNGYKIIIDMEEVYNVYKDIENGLKFKIYDSLIQTGISLLDMVWALQEDIDGWDTSFDEDMNLIEINVCD